MNKQTMIHLYNGLLSSDKNKWAIKPWKDVKETMDIVKWKKPV